MTNEEFEELRKLLDGYENLHDANLLFRKLAAIDGWVIGIMRYNKLKDLERFELQEEMKKFEQGFAYKHPTFSCNLPNKKQEGPLDKDSAEYLMLHMTQEEFEEKYRKLSEIIAANTLDKD